MPGHFCDFRLKYLTLPSDKEGGTLLRKEKNPIILILKVSISPSVEL